MPHTLPCAATTAAGAGHHAFLQHKQLGVSVLARDGQRPVQRHSQGNSLKQQQQAYAPAGSMTVKPFAALYKLPSIYMYTLLLHQHAWNAGRQIPNGKVHSSCYSCAGSMRLEQYSMWPNRLLLTYSSRLGFQYAACSMPRASPSLPRRSRLKIAALRTSGIIKIASSFRSTTLGLHGVMVQVSALR